MAYLPYTVINPYFGYCFRPGLTVRDFLGPRIPAMLIGGDGDESWLDLEPNEFGLWSRYKFPYEAGDDELVVGIFGGSAAQWAALQSGPMLEQRLSVLLKRNVRVLNFALGGSKQPQQAQALSYALHAGQKFDFVLNIDGFNELFFCHGNAQRGLEPSWPTVHMLDLVRTSINLDFLSPAHIRLLLKAARFREMQERWAARGARGGWHGNLSRRVLAWIERRQMELQTAIANTRQAQQFEMLMLPSPFGRAIELTPVQQWYRSSRIMRGLCEATGIEYRHILQPHYTRGDKPYTELEVAMKAERQSMIDLLRKMEPELNQRRDDLIAEGEYLTDASALFDQVTEQCYCDSAGHLTQRGNNLLVDWICTEAFGAGAA